MPPDFLAQWLLVFLRAGAMLSVFPVFSARNVPVAVRAALSALVAFLVTPGLRAVSVPPDLWGLAGLMSVEVAVGLLVGFVSRMIFFALETAGGIIGTEMGLSLPQSYNPLTSGQAMLPGTLLNYLATVLWLSLDLHHWLLLAFERTYAFLPAGGIRLREELLMDLLGRCGQLFVAALQIAAPLLAVSFMISLLFSVLGRAVPQMNVFAESFALRIMAGLTVFGMTCQLMAQHIINYLNRLPEDVLRIAQLLARATP